MKGLVYFCEDEVEISSYQSKSELQQMLANLMNFGSISGPKYYKGFLSSDLIFEGQSIGVEEGSKEKALKRSLPCVLTKSLSLRFYVGVDEPDKPTRSEIFDKFSAQI